MPAADLEQHSDSALRPRASACPPLAGELDQFVVDVGVRGMEPLEVVLQAVLSGVDDDDLVVLSDECRLAHRSPFV